MNERTQKTMMTTIKTKWKVSTTNRFIHFERKGKIENHV